MFGQPLSRRSPLPQTLGSMFTIRRYITVLGIMIALATLAKFVWSIPRGVSLSVLLIAWPLVGTKIAIDDDLAGGWSNPYGTLVPALAG